MKVKVGTGDHLIRLSSIRLLLSISWILHLLRFSESERKKERKTSLKGKAERKGKKERRKEELKKKYEKERKKEEETTRKREIRGIGSLLFCPFFLVSLFSLLMVVLLPFSTSLLPSFSLSSFLLSWLTKTRS